MNLIISRKFINLLLVISLIIPIQYVDRTYAYSQEKPIFYMFAKPGCYSGYSQSNPSFPMYSIKKIYPVSCFAPHHFEVFWAGQIRTIDGRVGAGGREVVNNCLDKSKRLGFYARNSKLYNWSVGEEQFIGNWMADMGVESQRFPNRSICYAGVTDRSWLYIKEINSPIIKGHEKYDN